LPNRNKNGEVVEYKRYPFEGVVLPVNFTIMKV